MSDLHLPPRVSSVKQGNPVTPFAISALSTGRLSISGIWEPLEPETTRTLVGREGAVSAIRGINAAAVGLLAAALYDPLWRSTVLAPTDFAIALVIFVVLAVTPRLLPLLAIEHSA